MRARVRATGAGRRFRSVMISGGPACARVSAEGGACAGLVGAAGCGAGDASLAEPGRLLAGAADRELAVADARRKSFGEFRGRLFAIGRNQLAQRGEQTRLREAIAVDAVETRFGQRFVQVAQRHLLLLEVGDWLLGRVDAGRGAHCEIDPYPGTGRRPSLMEQNVIMRLRET